MDKRNLTEKVDYKPILAVIKIKELSLYLLLVLSLFIVVETSLKIYIMGLVIYLLILRVIGCRLLNNLLYVVVYNLSLTCSIFGVTSAIIINLISKLNI